VEESSKWSAVLGNAYLERVLDEGTEKVRAILRDNGWDPSIADSLAPLFLVSVLSPYANLALYHPSMLMPYDENMPGPSLLKRGLLLIGSAPNGDFVAVNAADHPGAVVYVSHEEFDYDDLANLRDITRTIYPSVSDYLEALHRGTAPLDYWHKPDEEPNQAL